MNNQLSDVMKTKLGLEHSPIAISFSTEPPKGLGEMKGAMRLCQMLDKVRLDGESFYTTSRNHQCDGGATSCGLRERNERSKTGEFLFKELGLFGSKGAARRFINSNPRIEFGTVNVISFSPLEKAEFEPDVVALACNAKQGMRIAEASAYETGDRATGLTGPPICSAIVAAPYLTGEVVYSLGDNGVRRFTEIRDDELFVGIPAERLPEILDNLGKMKPS